MKYLEYTKLRLDGSMARDSQRQLVREHRQVDARDEEEHCPHGPKAAVFGR
jgi:hypothetical protein